MDTTHNTETNDTPKGRLAIREAILSAKPKDEYVEAFGVKIAVRPPALTELMQYREWQQDEYLLVRAMINHCYDPDSGEKIFEETDLEVLGAKTFGPDMKKLNGAIQKMLGDDAAIVSKVEDDTKSPKA